MRITYDTDIDAINLELISSKIIKRDAVTTPGGAYLYTRWRYELDCIYSSTSASATSYLSANTVRVATPGRTPITTDIALRHALLQPRKIFRMFAETTNETMLQVPKISRDGKLEPCDPAGGPTPQSVDVVAVDGLATFRVKWVIDLSYEECAYWEEDGAPILLSNEWTVSEGINDSLQVTFLFRGRAVFARGYLALKNLSPDDFRSQLLPECPDGFEQTDSRFDLEDDGVTLLWQVTYTSARQAILKAGIVDVECTSAYGESREDFLLGIAGAAVEATRESTGRAASRATGSIGRAFSGITRERMTVRSAIRRTGGLVNGIAGLAVAAGSVAARVFLAAQSTLPMSRWTIFCRVSGEPRTPQDNLRTVAYAAVRYRLLFNLNLNGNPFRVFEVYDWEEIHNPGEANFVEIRVSITQSLFGKFTQVLNNGIPGIENITGTLKLFHDSMTADDNTAPGIVEFNNAGNPPTPGAMIPGLDGNSRQENIVLQGQQLQGDCEPPHAPPLPRPPQPPGDPNFEGALRD